MNAQLIVCNTSAINNETGVPEIEAIDLLASGEDANLPENRVSLGKMPMYQALGLSSMPCAPDEDNLSWAEGVAIRNVGGWNFVCVGARDHRCAKIYGNLQPGDTVLHCTGPEPAPQVLLKREKRQVALVTKDESDNMLLSMLDGKNKKYQLLVAGYLVEVSDENGINLVDKTGSAGIQIKDGLVSIYGTVVLGGRVPVGSVMGGVAAPGAPVPGVFVGA